MCDSCDPNGLAATPIAERAVKPHLFAINDGDNLVVLVCDDSILVASDASDLLLFCPQRLDISKLSISKGKHVHLRVAAYVELATEQSDRLECPIGRTNHY